MTEPLASSGRAALAPSSEEEWIRAVRDLVDRGQLFFGWDLARTGLERYPVSRGLRQAGAVALLRAHALDEARTVLSPLVQDLEQRGSLDLTPGEVAGIHADEETLGLYARLFKGQWSLSGEKGDLARSRDIYRLSHRLTGGYYTGINAASLSFILGERPQAEQLAGSVVATVGALPEAERDGYWAKATLGEALLLLGRPDEACRAYREAATEAARKYAHLASSRQQLLLLQGHGLDIPEAIIEALKPPTIVVFAGHMIDSPARARPRFPPSIEAAVAEAIERELAAIDARIGYASAANGSDILFLEALQKRGGETNVVLPFAEADFVATSVAPAGERWTERFRSVKEGANTLTYSVTERYLGDDALFSHGNQVMKGLAHLRGRVLGTEPCLLAVRDGAAALKAGGTEETIRRWRDGADLRVVDIAALRETSRPPSRRASEGGPAPPASELGRKRRIRTILFADMVGFSKLQDENLDAFLECLRQLAEGLKKGAEHPEVVNTWGDAIFATMDGAVPMARYALRLRDTFAETAATTDGLPFGFGIRIALHVGPVYEAVDPLTRRDNCYGGAVNRAARLEPVTLPGHVYATRQFVALLAAEEADGGVWQGDSEFIGEQVGSLSLAKDFGRQDVYHLRRRRPLK